LSTVLKGPQATGDAAPGGVATFAAADGAGPAVPWTAAAVVFASLSVQIGVMWDISWHQSIGRDTLFSPPHLAIYLGGVVAGLTSAWLVLKATIAGSAAERAASVSFWKLFRGPLAAWTCIWGAIAMLTSAPFDDWWHNAYGLDVKILSPPHAVLAAGIVAITIGALLMVLPLQNRADDARRRPLALLYAFAFGLLVLGMGTMASEYHYRIFMHNSHFYIAAAVVFPILLAAALRSTRLAWPATAAAAAYSLVTLVMMWILPLFPAEPKLAPIYTQVTHMVAPSFPLLIIVGACFMDLVAKRMGGARGDWTRALALGAAFFVTFFVAQWFFAYFLMSEWARNPLFAADNIPYQVPPTSAFAQGRFVLQDAGPLDRAIGLAKGLVIAVLMTRAGLGLGSWMKRVQR
jgi:hypothetical protein